MYEFRLRRGKNDKRECRRGGHGIWVSLEDVEYAI